jgi:hypothetical protein
VLATSRVGLGLVGEATVPLGGLTAHDAATLFVARARLVQPGLGRPDEVVVGEICRLADGLPLAVELAAAHARTLPVPAIRDGMADRLRFLAVHDPDGAAPLSLAASLDRSAELVGDAALQALGALSVVDGRFPLEVAVALTGAREQVETLVDHSLVMFDAADGRYLLLDTVRAYAAAHAPAGVHGRLLVVNLNDIGAGPWRENRGREAMMQFWGGWAELFDGTFRQEILDATGFADRVVLIVHETGTVQGQSFDNRAIYLLELDDDGRWTSLRTVDMDHEKVRRFWAAVTLPEHVGAR